MMAYLQVGCARAGGGVDARSDGDPNSVLLRTPTNPERAAACPQCLIELEPEIAEDLLSSVDQPLQVANDKTKAKQYLLCDYNRDGDSYR